MKILLILSGVKEQGAGVIINLANELKTEVFSLLGQDKRQEVLKILKNSEPEEFVPAGTRLSVPHLTLFAEN